MNRTICLTIGLLCFCMGVSANRQAENVPLADPFILLEGDTYYAYGTHSAVGIEVYASTDLERWEPRGLALSRTDTSEDGRFWAPEVYHVGDVYYMYYSANEHLFVATASSPLGPFRQAGGPLMAPLIGDEKCIDGSVFIDDDGAAYLFLVRFTDGNCIWMCRLHADLMTPVEGSLTKCFSVSQPWEEHLGRVCEGPFILKRDGIYFLTYSGNDFRSPDYAVGYALAGSLTGEEGTGTSWQKYEGNPIVHRADGLSGTGHHSFFTDREGRLRIVFHAHHSATEVSPRNMFIATMEVNGNVLRLADEPVIHAVTVTETGRPTP